jgi:hypothetical protein
VNHSKSWKSLFSRAAIAATVVALSACIGADPEDQTGADVVWAPERQECYHQGVPVLVNGVSTEASCDALAGASDDGTLVSGPSASPQVGPQHPDAELCCFETCTCTPKGCECSGPFCFPC